MSHDALITLATELRKVTTEDERAVVMQNWKSSRLSFDPALQHTLHFINADLFHRKHATIEDAIKLDAQNLARNQQKQLTYNPLTSLVTELREATTEDERTVVMQNWKSSLSSFDPLLQHTLDFINADFFDRKHSTIEEAIEADMQKWAKRHEDEKRHIAHTLQLQATLEALLSF